MKILKVKSRVYNGKTYYKYRVNLPEEAINEADLKEGDKLKVSIKNKEIRLKKDG